jgi:hypothetical protein
MGCHCKCRVRQWSELLQRSPWKVNFSALYGTYTITLDELKAVLKASILADQTNPPKNHRATNNAGGWFPRSTEAEAVRHARNRRNIKESGSAKQNVARLKHPPPKEVVNRNFFAPLRAADIDTDTCGTEATSNEEAVPDKTGRPPPITLTSTTNLIQLHKQLKSVVRENLELRSTRNGTRVIARGMADFQSVKSHFDANNVSYYSFYPKSKKPMKAVICHLPHNTPAEDISDELVSLGFHVISVKQMTATRWSPSEGSTTINLPLFLITLPRMTKSQEIL